MVDQTCKHFEKLKISKKNNESSLQQLAFRISTSHGRCDECPNKKVKTSLLCLEDDCTAVGCARDDEKHALSHFQKHQVNQYEANPHKNGGQGGRQHPRVITNLKKDDSLVHCITINAVTLELWCYECDDYIQPKIATQLEALLNNDTKSSLPKKLEITDPRRSSLMVVVPPQIGVVGFRNVGNSCYMNAANQVLLACSALTLFMRKCPAFILRQPGNRRVSEALMNLVMEIYGDNVDSGDPRLSVVSTVGGVGGNLKPTNGSTGGFASVTNTKLHYSKSDCLTCPPVITPNQLIRAVRSVNSAFHGYTQQDAMDYIRCVLDRMHDELKREVCINSSKIIRSSKSNLDYKKDPTLKADLCTKNETPGDGSPRKLRRSKRLQSDLESEEKVKKESSSIISDTFGGVLRSEIRCLECGRISKKDDPFFDISVQITPPELIEAASTEKETGMKTRSSTKNMSSSLGVLGSIFTSIGESIGFGRRNGIMASQLQTCLAAFCAPEKLEGRDRYRCENCCRLVLSEKTLRIQKAPEILIVQLKRFRHDSFYSSKLGTPVIFPLEGLDLTSYMCGDVDENIKDLDDRGVNKNLSEINNESAEKLKNDQDGDAKSMVDDEEALSNHKYNLIGLVCHKGGYGGGHYVAYCRAPWSPSSSNLRAKDCENDDWLEYDDANVTPVRAEDVARVQAYCLVYQKKDPKAVEDRENMMSAISAAISGGEECAVGISRQWAYRCLTLMDPGPMNNADVSCMHGGIRVERALQRHLFENPRDLAIIPTLSPSEPVDPEKASIKDSPYLKPYDNIRIAPAALLHPLPRRIYDKLIQRYGELSGLEPPKVDMIGFCETCSHEALMMDKRRVEEEARVIALDTSTIAPGDCWYLIDSKWLQSWGAFKGNNGHAPPPGPISNEHLLVDLVANKGRNGLSRGVHYRGINRQVWAYFHSIYGGGPPIKRGTINIYAPPFLEDPSPGSDSAIVVDVVGHESEDAE